MSGVYYFQKDSLLLPAQEDISGPVLEIPLNIDNVPVIDRFTVPALADKGVISCAMVSPEAELPSDIQAVPVRQVLALLASHIADSTGPVAGMLRAFHIGQWRAESQFCGRCGSKNADDPGGPARICPACARMEFPRITPAIITIIINDEDKALLAHNKKFVPGMYSLIAGFAEAGENLEAAVARETREEVNIEIDSIRYIVSQSWPFPYALMIGFCARHVSGTITPDGTEIEDARWFGKNELPLLPGPGSVSRILIDRWLEGKM